MTAIKSLIESDKKCLQLHATRFSCSCIPLLLQLLPYMHTTLILKHRQDCERTFKSYKGLQYHLKRHRVPKDSLPCPHCKKVLAGRKRFENHIRLRHPDMDVELVVREKY